MEKEIQYVSKIDVHIAKYRGYDIYYSSKGKFYSLNNVNTKYNSIQEVTDDIDNWLMYREVNHPIFSVGKDFKLTKNKVIGTESFQFVFEDGKKYPISNNYEFPMYYLGEISTEDEEEYNINYKEYSELSNKIRILEKEIQDIQKKRNPYSTKMHEILDKYWFLKFKSFALFYKSG